jgi:hypothetical protein
MRSTIAPHWHQGFSKEFELSIKQNSYKFHLGYWVLVTIVSVMVWRSISEFGRSARLIKPDWLQHLARVCEDNKPACKSVEFVNSNDWWTSQKMVEVTPRKATSDEGAAAYRLIDDALTYEQREFIKVYLLRDSSDTKPTGGKP